MADLPLPPGVHVVKCLHCPEEMLAAASGARLKHNTDGSHTFIPPTPPKARTDPKPRGRRRG